MKKFLLPCVLLALIACGDGDDPTNPGAVVDEPRPLEFLYLNRLPQPDDLSAVSEFGGRAVAVGDLGTLMVFEEGARDWSRIASPTRARFTDVLMLDAARVLAITNADGIWLSEDFAGSWELVHETTRVRKLAYRNGITVAAGGEVLVSEDLRNWKSPRVPPDLSRFCEDVAFAGDLIWVLEPDALHRSDDGGETWVKRVLAPELPFAALAFADQDFGVVATRDGELFNTTNGSTFNPLQELGSRVVDIDFPFPGFGVLVTQDLTISMSLSRGKDWQSTAFVGIGERPVDIEATTDGELLMVGTDGFIAESDGSTLLREISSGFTEDVNVLAFANASDGVAIASVPGFFLFRTSNGGLTWQKGPSPVPNPEDAEFLDESLGLILDGSGAILKTTNLGASWTDTGASSTSPGMIGLFILDAQTWMACGSEAKLIRTDDAGATWTEVQLSTTDPVLRDIIRVPGTEILLACSFRSIYRSEDRGVTWTEIQGDVRGGEAIACPDANTIISVSEVIYRSEDQGLTWVAVQDSPETLYSVEFLDPRHGIAVGDDGMIFETFDSGKTWQEVQIVGQPLLDVVVLDEDTVLMAGEDAVVIAGQRARKQ